MKIKYPTDKENIFLCHNVVMVLTNLHTFMKLNENYKNKRKQVSITPYINPIPYLIYKCQPV